MLIWLLHGCLFDRGTYERRLEELTDHDGDGYALVDDCDDADASIAPGLPEHCDGIDEDCDGVADDDALDARAWYSDLDGDGFGVAGPERMACDDPKGFAPNTLDCDDGDPLRSPSETDVPYDGVDQDCDGADLTDVDGDAFEGAPAGGDDCDDEDGAVHPGAAEVAYDGIDQDCAGGDLTDLDGDGVDAPQVGGDDCDDDDAAVYPEAEETWANGFTDNDCDGAPGAAQLDFGGRVWASNQAGGLLGREVAAGGDLDADGLDDVLLASEYDSTLGSGSGAIYAVDGAPGGTALTTRALLPERPGTWFASSLDAGVDVTTDGVGDVVVSAPGDGADLGESWLVDGKAWASAGAVDVDAVALGAVAGSSATSFGPTTVRFVGDMTGDGIEDVAMSECCGTSSGPASTGRVAIVSSDDFEGSIEDAAVVMTGPWDGAYMGGTLDPIGDQDGDGLAEVLVGGMSGLAAAVVGGSRSGTLTDLAIMMVYGDVSEGYADARAAGDLDGDGAEDIAVLGDYSAGTVYLFTAVASAPTRTLDAPSATITWVEHGGVADIVPLGDLDRDGQDELLLAQYFSDSGNQRLWLIPGADVRVAAIIPAESARLTGLSVV